MKIAGVRFRVNWKVYDFDATDTEVSVGDKVIVDSDRGLGFAVVVRLRKTALPPIVEPVQKEGKQEEVEVELSLDGEEDLFPEATSPSPNVSRGFRKIIRKATNEDIVREEKNRARESDAFMAAQTMMTERELPMKLIRVEYSFDASRATFFFFSETRVDFREIVKDLASKLKSRIEMRQIGVRDVARMIGGFGPCGRELCCSSFLKNFEPVSIRMAKKQEMVLNPAKISGVCGRLLCCLSYEFGMYEENKKDLLGMREAAMKGRKEEEEQRIVEARKEADERKLTEEKKRVDERRQEQRRDRPKEGQQKGAGKSEKKEDRERGKKSPQRSTLPKERLPQSAPEKPQTPETAPDQRVQQQNQEGDKSGKKRRFWRRKKKGSSSGENKPQGPGKA